MSVRLPDRDDGEEQADEGDADAEIEGLRPQRIVAGDIPGDPRRGTDGEVTGELVEAERQTSPAGPDEVDLHDDRHRPSEGLVDAEQYVRQVDPGPRRRIDDQEGNG